MVEDNIYQKLQHIHAQVKYIQKSQKATQYSYAGSSDVLGQIHGCWMMKACYWYLQL